MVMISIQKLKKLLSVEEVSGSELRVAGNVDTEVADRCFVIAVEYNSGMCLATA